MTGCRSASVIGATSWKFTFSSDTGVSGAAGSMITLSAPGAGAAAVTAAAAAGLGVRQVFGHRRRLGLDPSAATAAAEVNSRIALSAGAVAEP